MSADVTTVLPDSTQRMICWVSGRPTCVMRDMIVAIGMLRLG